MENQTLHIHKFWISFLSYFKSLFSSRTRRGMLNLFLSEGTEEDEPALPSYLATLSHPGTTRITVIIIFLSYQARVVEPVLVWRNRRGWAHPPLLTSHPLSPGTTPITIFIIFLSYQARDAEPVPVWRNERWWAYPPLLPGHPLSSQHNPHH